MKVIFTTISGGSNNNVLEQFGTEKREKWDAKRGRKNKV